MTAYQQCACRPGCLARLTVDDDVVLTEAGYALVQHTRDVGEQLAFDASEVAS